MDHTEISKILPWYVNATLSEEEKSVVEHHLDRCEHCAGEVEELRLLETAVVELDAQVQGPSPELWPRALSRINREKDMGPKRTDNDRTTAKLRWFWGGNRATPSFGLLAAAMAALVALIAFQNLWTIPRLRSDLGALTQPGPYQATVLKPMRRNASENLVEIRRSDPVFLVEFDVNLSAPDRFRSYEVLLAPRDGQPTLITREASPPKDRLKLRIPTKGLRSGSYRIQVVGLPDQAENSVEYLFELKITEGA